MKISIILGFLKTIQEKGKKRRNKFVCGIQGVTEFNRQIQSDDSKD